MCKFKVGDVVNSISGKYWDGDWQNCIITKIDPPYKIWARNPVGREVLFINGSLELVKRKEETMFEVGKKYNNPKSGRDRAKVVFIDGDDVVLRWELEGRLFTTSQFFFKDWKEYKEPKTYTSIRDVVVDGRGNLFTSYEGSYKKGFVGKIRLTYVEGSGLTVDVLE